MPSLMLTIWPTLSALTAGRQGEALKETQKPVERNQLRPPLAGR